GTGDLEHRQVTGDPAALGMDLGGGDVVGDGEDPGLDALLGQYLHGTAELQHVAGVVAEPEQHTTARGGGAGHGDSLGGRGGGNDVAADGAVGHPLPDPAGERRVVAGAAAQHERDLTRRGLGGPYRATVGGHHPVGVGADEAGQHVGREL